MAIVEIRVPDIGDFKDVPVIEIHVAPGDTVNPEDPLITLESDKASLEVPAPQAGTVVELKLAQGDLVSQGSVIMTLEAAGAAATPPKERVSQNAAPAAPGGPASYGSASGVYETIDVEVPDIGDFADVEVIEVHVTAGSSVRAEDPLLTLESDKASMDTPSPAAGTIAEVLVKPGDRVSKGTRILKLRSAASGNGASIAMPPAASAARPPVATPGDLHAEILVLGAGPGGYTAAFRAADLGKQVVLVERWRRSVAFTSMSAAKALLHAAKVVTESEEMGAHGISFTAPSIDLDKLRDWKDGVVKRLTGGLSGLARQRKVTVLQGTGQFISVNQLAVQTADGTKIISFEQAIIAAGSEPVTLPFIPHQDPRVVDSTGALALGGVPKRLLVIGGGIIGLEMATVYHALGTKVTIVEFMDQIIPGADRDIVTPLMKRIQGKYETILLKTKVTKVEAAPDGWWCISRAPRVRRPTFSTAFLSRSGGGRTGG
jgi:dihydrolipoamide dehydrogenase